MKEHNDKICFLCKEPISTVVCAVVVTRELGCCSINTYMALLCYICATNVNDDIKKIEKRHKQKNPLHYR